MSYAGMVAPRPLEKSAVFPCRWARYLRVYFRGGFAPASLKQRIDPRFQLLIGHFRGGFAPASLKLYLVSHENTYTGTISGADSPRPH